MLLHFDEICVLLQFEMNESMKKSVLITLCAVLLLTGCAKEFNQVYKSDNYQYKYEYAKECYARGKYTRAISILEGIVTMLKGSQNGQECLYMLAMAEYNNKDYETAAEYFRKYYSSYPRGDYAELAKFYVGQSLFMSTPEPRLDQSQTLSAITAFQEYLDIYPTATKKQEAQERLFSLQDNFLACIITAENALKDYPYSSLREDFSVLLMKSKFELAENSVEAKRLERYQDAEDECYGFINEFPDSKNKSLAEKFIEKCKKHTKNADDQSEE